VGDRNVVLALSAKLAGAHDWVSDPSLVAIFQALPGASFIVNGATPAKNSALVSAGSELRLANGVTLLGKFRRRIRPRLLDLCRHRHAACQLVIPQTTLPNQLGLRIARQERPSANDRHWP
jgi:hypothetical protein